MMTNSIIRVKLLLVLFFGCSQLMAFARHKHPKKAVLYVINPSGIPRKDELVVITRAIFQKKTRQNSLTRYPVLRKQNGELVRLQVDDINGDGVWDEFCFLLQLQPHERCVFKLGSSTCPSLAVLRKAHVRHRRLVSEKAFGPSLIQDSIPAGQLNTDFSKEKLPPFLTEGPAWENDKIGFRIYFDRRNTKDIWGKTTDTMIMDSVGVDHSSNYHHLSDWGMDILAVGRSLGAGSLAMKFTHHGKDTLVRLGGTEMGPVRYRLIADGPVRAIFKLIYPASTVVSELNSLSVTEEISIWGGQHFYQSTVKLVNRPAGAYLVTGIVRLKASGYKSFRRNKTVALYTYDRQSENNDLLGLAILTRSNKHTIPFEVTSLYVADIADTYGITIPAEPNGISRYRFYAGWELTDPRFRTENGFRSFLENEVAKYNSPLTVK